MFHAEFVIGLAFACCWHHGHGFLLRQSPYQWHNTLSNIRTTSSGYTKYDRLLAKKKRNTNIRSDSDGEDGEVGTGPNWIERSFPVAVGGEDDASDLKKVEDYDLGISGVSFQTGGLSKRMFDAIMSRSQFSANPSEEIRQSFVLYALDFSAKEAVKAALKQNGLELALQEEEEDAGMWGDFDSIRLLDLETEKPLPGVYDSTEEAIQKGGWKPGQGFDFVVRHVPAKLKELSLDELLQALDPDGSLREEAREANMTLPGDDLETLSDLANDCVRRSENAPRGTTTEETSYAGTDNRGYRPIHRSAVLQREAGGNENYETLMHVMDAFVSHGALIVDMTNGGKDFEVAQKLAKMWNGIQKFFDKVDADKQSVEGIIPPMTTVMETGSQAAKVGFASYDNDSMQFLETRRNRHSGALLPEEAKNILEEEATNALRKVFDDINAVGKSVVRIAVAASSSEAGAFDIDDNPDVAASNAAALMADELLDDGGVDSNANYPICMSPQRLCRYSNNPKSDADESENMDQATSSREVFGAHTDTTWVTMVPVAAISGLEVFDEGAEKWYRPELAARKQWQKEQQERGEDAESHLETVQEAVGLPWHCRYVVLMPGELLQLATRDEVPAAVHRVVATQNSASRLSAPILLRCRPGVKMDVSRYLGDSNGNALLEQCDGMTIEQIHNALQPTSFQ